MNIIVFQHVPSEYPGAVLDWANENGIEITLCKSYSGETITDISKYDAFVFLGGPMSVHEKNKYSWIIEEEELIRKAFGYGKKVVGICLGAQMIADTFGAEVFRLENPEIGWHNLRFLKGGKNGTNTLYNMVSEIFPSDLPVFHWHGEMFNLPVGAVKIAESDACPNQGFIMGENLAAFQFHIEIKQNGIMDLIQNCGDDLVNSPYIQSADQIEELINQSDVMNHFMKIFLDRFFI